MVNACITLTRVNIGTFAVMDKLNYLSDPETYISEQSDIEKDMNDFGLKNNSVSDDTEHTFSHLIFVGGYQ